MISTCCKNSAGSALGKFKMQLWMACCWLVFYLCHAVHCSGNVLTYLNSTAWWNAASSVLGNWLNEYETFLSGLNLLSLCIVNKITTTSTAGKWIACIKTSRHKQNKGFKTPLWVISRSRVITISFALISFNIRRKLNPSPAILQTW